MNQKSRQNAKNAIKKDFFKLTNNTNFGHDCRNNADNAKFEPIIEDIDEIGYIKKHYNLFDTIVSSFVNRDLLEKQVKQDFQQQMANIRPDNPLKAARKALIKNKDKDKRDAIDCLKKKEKNQRKESSREKSMRNWPRQLKTKK